MKFYTNNEAVVNTQCFTPDNPWVIRASYNQLRKLFEITEASIDYTDYLHPEYEVTVFNFRQLIFNMECFIEDENDTVKPLSVASDLITDEHLSDDTQINWSLATLTEEDYTFFIDYINKNV